MNKLANAFSLLDVDVAGDKVDASIVTVNNENQTPNGTGPLAYRLQLRLARLAMTPCGASIIYLTQLIHDAGKGKKKDNHSTKDDKSKDVVVSEATLTGYRMPLVWIDLEMTGLNVEVDRILEIACIVTDGNLSKSVEGPDLVIKQTKECLDKMGEWCQEHHAASGLTKKVLFSTTTEEVAEKQVFDFVKKHVGTYTLLLAGNSIYMDFLFLKKYMPKLASLFSHVLVDVSSVKALCLRWYPRDSKKAPQKQNKHRAMDDIKESIAELKYYKEYIFKSKGKM